MKTPVQTNQIRAEISRRMSIADLLRELYPGHSEGRKSGDNFFYLCPWHEEKTPSCSVSRGKNLIYCHACKQGGDAVWLYAKAKGISTEQATLDLARRRGLAVDGQVLEDIRHAERVQKVLDQTLAICQDHLESAPATREYYTGRGIPAECFKRLELAAYPGGIALRDKLIDSGHSPEDVRDAQVCFFPAGNLDAMVFPYHSHPSELTRLKLRQLSSKKNSFFLGPSGIQPGFFGLHLYDPRRGDGRVVVVEGEFDVLSLQTLSIRERGQTTNIIATSGGGLDLGALERLGVKTAYLYADHDEGGFRWVSHALKGRK